MRTVIVKFKFENEKELEEKVKEWAIWCDKNNIAREMMLDWAKHIIIGELKYDLVVEHEKL